MRKRKWRARLEKSISNTDGKSAAGSKAHTFVSTGVALLRAVLSEPSYLVPGRASKTDPVPGLATVRSGPLVCESTEQPVLRRRRDFAGFEHVLQEVAQLAH
jgi:hypothetical protein